MPSYLPAFGTVSTCEPTTKIFALAERRSAAADQIAERIAADLQIRLMHPFRQAAMHITHRRRQKATSDPTRFFAEAGENVAALLTLRRSTPLGPCRKSSCAMRITKLRKVSPDCLIHPASETTPPDDPEIPLSNHSAALQADKPGAAPRKR